MRRRRLGLGTHALAAAVLMVVNGCTYPGLARPACADAVLDEWTKGTLDAAYPADCYEAAIDALPEDLRAYTTAADDISRAAVAANRGSARVATERDSSQARQFAGAPTESNRLRAFPLLVVLLVALVTVLFASGLAASAIRRRRAR